MIASHSPQTVYGTNINERRSTESYTKAVISWFRNLTQLRNSHCFFLILNSSFCTHSYSMPLLSCSGTSVCRTLSQNIESTQSLRRGRKNEKGNRAWFTSQDTKNCARTAEGISCLGWWTGFKLLLMPKALYHETRASIASGEDVASTDSQGIKAALQQQVNPGSEQPAFQDWAGHYVN